MEWIAGDGLGFGDGAGLGVVGLQVAFSVGTVADGCCCQGILEQWMVVVVRVS